MLRAERRRALLTVDLEDYRSIRLRDHGQVSPTVHPAEVEREVHLLLELFDSLGASATFFCVGRLAADLAPSVWQEIVRSHPLGAHSFEHERVWQLGARRFEEDLRRTKAALEQVSGREVLSYRAPYFSNDGCNPWFGELLARAGIVIDSSQRLMLPPRGFRGTLPLLGSDGLVTEVPFPSLGIGGKRITVIGGTYFRLLPLPVVRSMLTQAERLGFLPMVYLHPYDLDPDALPLELNGARRTWRLRGGEWMRYAGRASAAARLRALGETYEFHPIESILQPSPAA